MYKALSLAGLALAVEAGYVSESHNPSVTRMYGGSTSGNRFVDDLADGYPDPSSPYGHRHTSGTHSDHGHGTLNGWNIGHSHQYLTPTRDYILHEHGDGLAGPGGRYGDQMGGRYGLTHRWGQYNGYNHGHNPAGGHGWGDHDDHDIGEGHGHRLTWGRGTHGAGSTRDTWDHGYGLVTPGHTGLRRGGLGTNVWGGYAGVYDAPERSTRNDNLSSTYRLPSETDYNRVRQTRSYTTVRTPRYSRY